MLTMLTINATVYNLGGITVDRIKTNGTIGTYPMDGVDIPTVNSLGNVIDTYASIEGIDNLVFHYKNSSETMFLRFTDEYISANRKNTIIKLINLTPSDFVGIDVSSTGTTQLAQDYFDTWGCGFLPINLDSVKKYENANDYPTLWFRVYNDSIFLTSAWSFRISKLTITSTLDGYAKSGDWFYKIDNSNHTASLAFYDDYDSTNPDGPIGPNSMVYEVVIPNTIIVNNTTYTVTSIGKGAFASSRVSNSLSIVSIPSSIKTIENGAFAQCYNLNKVLLECNQPPMILMNEGENINLFPTSNPYSYGSYIPFSINIFIPCGSIDAYQNADGWKKYKSWIRYESAKVSGQPSDYAKGSVNIPDNATICESFEITAIPNDGYHFARWTDGNTDNPRIVSSTAEMTYYTAEFEADKSGKCGDDLLLTWQYDSDTKTLTISGNGKLDSNMHYGVEAYKEMTNLVIEDGVESIGTRAFAEYKTLTTISLGKDIKKINERAFYNCENLTTIYNYAPTPATIYSTTFDGVNKFICNLYVTNGSLDMYKNASGWRDFYNIIEITTALDIIQQSTSKTTKYFKNGNMLILMPDGTKYTILGNQIK